VRVTRVVLLAPVDHHHEQIVALTDADPIDAVGDRSKYVVVESAIG
jgi:hypothetical protein